MHCRLQKLFRRLLRCVLRSPSFLCALIVSGCAIEPARPTEPLIRDIAGSRWINVEQLADQLAMRSIVLLGELHDSTFHHHAQRELLAALIARGRRPAIAFEQFDTEHQPALDAARKRTPAPDAEGLADAGRFNRQGWNWPLYRPLVEMAVVNQLPILAANLARADARQIMLQGFAGLGAGRAVALGLPPKFDTEIRAALAAEIVASHCGMISADKAMPMVNAQQARDAVMAEAIRHRTQDGVVLVAGNGHVRRDRGVPRYLGGVAADQIAVVGFVEADNLHNPYERERLTLTDHARYHYIWFTPPTNRGDPCAAFRRPVVQ